MQQSCIRPCKQRLKRRASYSVIRFTVPDVLMLYCVLSICCRWRKSSATRKTKDILKLSEQEQALPGNLSSAVRKSYAEGSQAIAPLLGSQTAAAGQKEAVSQNATPREACYTQPDRANRHCATAPCAAGPHG